MLVCFHRWFHSICDGAWHGAGAQSPCTEQIHGQVHGWAREWKSRVPDLRTQRGLRKYWPLVQLHPHMSSGPFLTSWVSICRMGMKTI